MRKIKNTPFDYSDERIWVYFEVADIKLGRKAFENFDFIEPNQMQEKEFGFEVFVCNQHIPEIVRELSQENMAIYQIVRNKQIQEIDKEINAIYEKYKAEYDSLADKSEEIFDRQEDLYAEYKELRKKYEELDKKTGMNALIQEGGELKRKRA